ncbi:MAG: efflux RND transporter periplasmic adaptor subunit, partial [Mesorhizobium sp.]
MRISFSQHSLPTRRMAVLALFGTALLLAACSQEKSQVPAGMGGAGRPEVGVITLHPQSVAITA